MTNELDARAVAAVQQGDRERYRELVERHADKVYAVAWCRLGDRDLAEEAAQEAFIKAYHHLGFLKSGAKFGSWIAAIARNLATNLGLRHRRELARRERWVLTAVEPGHAPEKETTSVETLRDALVELPATHRECLVLFYLEGKSITESAALLDLSETAFKTRLHRARAALRVALEARLEDSLRDLRPSRQLLPGIMAALPPEPLGAAAGGLAGLVMKAATGLGKLIPTAFLISLLPLLSLAVGFLAGGWAARRQAKNYRDPEGFRARLFETGLRRNLLVLLLILAGMAAMRVAVAYWERNGLLAGLFLLALFGISAAWNLAKIQSRQKAWSFAGAFLCQAGGVAGVELFDLPVWFAWYGFGAFALLLAFSQRNAWPRMDESLFLRAANGLLPPPDNSLVQDVQMRSGEVKEFARFLGTRLLITDRRCREDAMELRLAELRPSIPRGFFYFYWNRCSTARIHHNGRVEARRGERDTTSLAEMGLPPGDEEAVAGALQSALRCFLAGDIPGAEKSVGQRPVAEIYHRPPEKTAFLRFGRWLQIGSGLFLISIATYEALTPPFLLRRLRPLQATATDVSHSLRLQAETKPTRKRPWQELEGTIATSWLLPAKTSLDPEAKRAVDTWLRGQVQALEMLARTNKVPLADTILWSDSFVSLLLNGWLDDLNPPLSQINPNVIRAGLEYRFAKPIRLRPLADLRENEYTGEERTLRLGLPLLYRFERLDLVDVARLIRDLAARQILSEKPGVGRLVPRYRGLFHLGGRNPVQDAFVALSSLELLGGLKTIDREACIAGLLRLHYGRGAVGYFPQRGPQIFSEPARDTYCAFESLRLLGALDRVKDLSCWEIRVESVPARTKEGELERVLYPFEIEAWAAWEYFRQVTKQELGNSIGR